MAKYDLRLTWEEFEELTPGMLRALCKRRNIRIKYERFAHAMTASAIYNSNRTSDDQPLVQAMDFVRDEEQAAKREQSLSFKRFINDSIKNVPMNAPRSKFLEVRRSVIEKLAANGCANAEAMFDAKWPSLKPQEGEA